MELETINYYFNFSDATFIISSFSLLIFVYAFFEIFQSILKWYKSRQNIPPGPTGLPFLGSLPLLGREPHKTIWNMRKKYGGVISIYLGPKYSVVLNDYKVVKEVFSHPGSLDRGPDLLNHLEHIGFLAENGSRWLEQRKFTMSSAKSVGLGKALWETLVMEELSSFILKLQELKGKPIDISKHLLHSINTSILSLLIGRRLGEDEIDKILLASNVIDAVLTKLGPSNPVSVVPGLRKIYEFFKIDGHKEAKQTIRQFSSFIKEEIQRHKTSQQFKNIPDFINCYLEKISEMSKTDNKDHSFSETMLEGNIAMLFLAASDTMYSSLEWLIRIMCKYPEIQKKVHAELVRTFGKNELATYTEREKIPYTFAVLMEGQRYASNVPLSTTRRANQDIPVNGYVIPKGSDIIANMWGLHHDPDYWDKPDEFLPERFLTNEGMQLIKHPPSFVPFSYGKRKCPGERIAWMQILYYFSEILKKFEVSTPPGVEPQFEIIKGIVIQLVPQPLCFKERYN